jgi:hypothetical protein
LFLAYGVKIKLAPEEYPVESGGIFYGKVLVGDNILVGFI